MRDSIDDDGDSSLIIKRPPAGRPAGLAATVAADAALAFSAAAAVASPR